MRVSTTTAKDQRDDLDATTGVSQAGSRAISEIVQEIFNHVIEIIHSEIRLARTEVGQEIRKAAKASVLLLIGAVLTFFALGFMLLGAVYALASTLPQWLSAVLVGGGAGLLAAVFLLVGRSKVRRAGLKRAETIHSFQENAKWSKQPTR